MNKIREFIEPFVKRYTKETLMGEVSVVEWIPNYFMTCVTPKRMRVDDVGEVWKCVFVTDDYRINNLNNIPTDAFDNIESSNLLIIDYSTGYCMVVAALNIYGEDISHFVGMEYQYDNR